MTELIFTIYFLGIFYYTDHYYNLIMSSDDDFPMIKEPLKILYEQYPIMFSALLGIGWVIAIFYFPTKAR